MAGWVKLADGSWGIWASDARTGEQVTVTRKDGKQEKVILGEEVAPGRFRVARQNGAANGNPMATVATVPAHEAAANLDRALARLDADQATVAAWTPDAGNLRVVAAAGSGKTTTVVALVGRLLRDGQVAPGQLVATTFTSKAGKELAERIAKVVAPDVFGQLRVGTFHSLAIRALRAAGHPTIGDFARCLDGNRRAAGIPAASLLWTFILGWGDVKGTSLRGIDIADADAKAYGMAADLIRAHGHEPGSVEARKAALAVEESGLVRFGEAWALFSEAKRQFGAWDFADALAVYRAGLTDGSIRDGAQVVIVDEAQDNNFVQLDTARLLSRQGRIILVGDVRQSIYEWRGAFPQLFATADVEIAADTAQVRQNYRSGRKIVELANRVADGKSWSIGDAQRPARDADGVVRALASADPADEADRIADEVEAALTDKGARADDFAVLGRTNASLAPIEAALVQRKIPCVVVGGTSFFARRDVKDALAYLALAQADDIESFERIVNRPKRFLGKAFVAQVRAAFVPGRSIADAVEAAGATVNRRQVEGVRELVSVLRALRAAEWTADAAEGKHPADLVADLLAPPPSAGLTGDDDKPGLVSTVAAIARTFASAADLTRFAAACAGAVEEVAEGEQPTGRVTISTVHRAKGLEWSSVYVLATAGVFPHRRTEGDPKRASEEERLFYVAVTRAKDTLTLSHAEQGPYKGTGGESPFVTAYVDRPEGGPQGPQGGGYEPSASEIAAEMEARAIEEHGVPAALAERAQSWADRRADQLRAAGRKVAVVVETGGQLHPEQGSIEARALAGIDDPSLGGGHREPGLPIPPIPAGDRIVGVDQVRAALAALDLLIPTAHELAERRTDQTPKSTDGSRFVPVTRGDFEELLVDGLGFDETDSHGQVVYTYPLGPITLLVYSTLPVGDVTVRDVGEDSIKVALVRAATDAAPERALMKKQPYACRTRGWRVALLARIEEALSRVRGNPPCRKCGSPTIQQDGREKGTRFYGCIGWPTCKGSAGEVAAKPQVEVLR